MTPNAQCGLVGAVIYIVLSGFWWLAAGTLS